MSPKIPSVITYITPLGWIIAYLLHRSNPNQLSNVHLKNSLGLHAISILSGYLIRMGGVMASLVSIITLACFVLMIVGIVYAISGESKPIPLIGEWLQSKIPNL